MIYFNGCSFTKGHEMDARDVDAFPSLVALDLDQEFYNHAKIGGTNERIQRTTQNYILRSKKEIQKNDKKGSLVNRSSTTAKVDFAVIMLTGINRREFMKDTKWKNATWKKYQLDSNYLPTSDSYIWEDRELDEETYLAQNAFIKTRSAMFCLKWTISYMLATKYFLKAHDIPYLFYTFSSQHYKPLLHLLDEKYYEEANFAWPSNEIDKRQVLKELPFLKDDGFLEICKKDSLPTGKKDHPLEDGHKRMTEVILGDIKDKWL